MTRKSLDGWLMCARSGWGPDAANREERNGRFSKIEQSHRLAMESLVLAYAA